MKGFCLRAHGLSFATGLLFASLFLLAQATPAKSLGPSDLVAAIKAKDGARVSSLLHSGADFNGRDANGMTPLHYASNAGDLTADVLLIAAGADVNAKDFSGRTPLHAAASSGRADIAKLLLAKGSAANARDRAGLTPLHQAAASGSRELADLLVASGADVGATSTGGLTPADEASRSHHQALADFLRSEQASPAPSRGSAKARIYTNDDLGAVRQRSRLANEEQLDQAHPGGAGSAVLVERSEDTPPTATSQGKSTLVREQRDQLQRAFEDGAWNQDIEASQRYAKEVRRPVLALFTGSDWCHFCKLLESNVLSTSTFHEWVKGKYILLYIDFPCGKSVPKEELDQRTRLAEKYSVRAYPTLVILKDGDQLLDRINGFKQGMTAEKYIARIEEIAP